MIHLRMELYKGFPYLHSRKIVFYPQIPKIHSLNVFL